VTYQQRLSRDRYACIALDIGKGLTGPKLWALADYLLLEDMKKPKHTEYLKQLAVKWMR
jgi:hypothetical protein